MQPHSISAMAVAKHIFANKYGESVPSSAEVQMDWTNPVGQSKYIYHYISHIEITKKNLYNNILELKVTVKTTDGSPCTLTIRRLSNGEFKQGEKLIATHSVQHRAGLEEHYELSRRSIRGTHRGSWKYGDFVCTDAGEGSFVLQCTVRVGNTNNFKKIPYKVTVRPKGEIPVKSSQKEEHDKKTDIRGKIIPFTFGRDTKKAA